MRKIIFEHLALKDQIGCVYDWYYHNDIYSRPPAVMLQLCARYELFDAIQQHFINSRDRVPKLRAKEINASVLEFLERNEITKIEEVTGPLLTLLKLTVLK